MKINTEQVQGITAVLDGIIKEYKKEHPKKERDWRTCEQRAAVRLRTAFRELKPLVREAASSIQFASGEPTLGPQTKLGAIKVQYYTNINAL